MRGEGMAKNFKPSGDLIMALELCISDENKPLLINNADFVTYLVDALLLDPTHPRAEMKLELKNWCHDHHTECFAQLAVFGPSRETLRQDPSVIPASAAGSGGGRTGSRNPRFRTGSTACAERQGYACRVCWG